MIYYETELYHHGTKGQKWGKRLYQNPDGSLTALGRLRYGKNGERFNKSSNNKRATGKNSANSKSFKEDSESKLKTKSAREMSDDDLNKAINRMRLENTYNDLMAKQIPPDKNARIKKIAADLGEQAVKNIGGKVIDTIGDKITKKLSGPEEIDDTITDYNFKDVTKVSDAVLSKALKRVQKENQYRSAMDMAKSYSKQQDQKQSESPKTENRNSNNLRNDKNTSKNNHSPDYNKSNTVDDEWREVYEDRPYPAPSATETKALETVNRLLLRNKRKK